MIRPDITIILIIVVFGDELTLVLHKLTSYEFKNSFQIIEKIEKYAHSKTRVLWNLAKVLTYL